MSAPLRVGLIGWGAIAHEVAATVGRRDGPAVEIVGVLSRSTRADAPSTAVASVHALLDAGPDVVVEVAGQEALHAFAPTILRRGVPVLCTSVGALADHQLVEELDAACCEGGTRLIIPSGAVGGLDILRAAAVGGLERVEIEQCKPPHVLLDADAAAAVTEPVVLFRGAAREAARRYPTTMNIVAAVALAGVGLDRTTAALVADPALEAAAVHVTAHGAFGRLALEIDHRSSDNPATSIVTPWSVVATLENAFTSRLVFQ